jgi:hypothetical protein
MEITVTGFIRKGKLEIRGRKALAERVRRMRDGEVTVTIERAHATRSKAQNDYYWSVVVERVAGAYAVAMQRPVPPKEAHELLKAQFLPHDMAAKGRNGTLMNGLVFGGSTAKLDKLQFIEYLEAIVGWAAEKWHVYIPDPDPEWRARAEDERQKAEAA